MSPAGRPSTASTTGAGWAPLAWLTLLGVLGLVGKPTPHGNVAMSQSQAVAPASGRAEPPSGTRGNTGSSGDGASGRQGDTAPGEPKKGGTDVVAGVRGYLIGMGLAALLTAGSFALSYTHLVYGPGVPVALLVFAVAQVGIHLIFFLHLTTSPDNINNSLALVFGVLILVLLIAGTLWIMGHMNANMMPMGQMAPGQMMNMAP